MQDGPTSASGPRLLADRYELGDVIGAGGMARVHRATDRFLDRQVAIKLLDEAAARSADPATHRRFLNEARSAASFDHPNAVAVYDAGESDGQLYIVMELVTGATLADRLAEDGPLPAETACDLAAQLLEVLSAMHERQIVHRDVKPSNVLFDRDGRVKLTDFGIAKRLDEIDEALTSDGLVVGTPQYLAPEQAVGGEIAATTDVYLVGALLYEMLTGARPASPLSGSHTRSTDPRDRRADVHPAVAAVVERALSYLPEQRFPTAAAMHPALAATGAGDRRRGSSDDGPADDTSRVTPTAEFPADGSATTTGELAISGDSAHDEVTGEIPVVESAPPSSDTPTEAIRAVDHGTGDGTGDDAGLDAVATREPTTAIVPTAPPQRRSRRALYGVVAILAAVVTIGLVVAIAGGGNDEPTPTDPEQMDASEFLRRLRADPDEFGPRGADVRDELEAVLAITDPDERAAAEEALRVDIFVWVAEGELDTAVGGLVDAVLHDG